MDYYLYKSSRKDKKLMVIHGSHTIHFGATGYQDFIASRGDESKKKKYISRHNNEDWNDLLKAGTWARYILWNKPTLKESIEDMMTRFKIRIIRKVDYP